MAEPRNPGGRLAEGAARLERLARIVKDSQLARTKAKAGPAVTEAFVLSPEEAWAKKYMTHCIGPVCFEAPAEPSVFAKYAAQPSKPAASQGYSTETAPAPPRDAGPIGLAIGKPPRRSWVGRLFGR